MITSVCEGGCIHLCPSRFTNIEMLNEHLHSVHGISINKETKKFDSFQDFLKWKAEEEAHTNSLYVQHLGSRVRGNTTWWYFYCNRSGHYNPRGSGRRMLKSQGSSKMGETCSAHLKVERNDTTGHVTAHYCSTHHSHKKQIAHLKIPEQVRLNIAAKLHQGVVIEKIMDDIRDNAIGESSREHIISRQDIRNVLREFNILGIEKHTNDHSSVHAWVTEMRSQEYNPVLFFKHQGTEDQENILQKDDFLLCISI